LTGGCARQRTLPSSTPCRGNCDDEEGTDDNSGSPEGFLAEPPPDYDRSQLSVPDQPQPDTVLSRAAEAPTSTDEVMEAGQYPERTEFVVHVQQEPDSEPAEAHRHHAASESSGGSGRNGNSGRRHHRLPCWDYERRERQCLNGGQCFAIQLHNGIRRAGCRSPVYLAPPVQRYHTPGARNAVSQRTNCGVKVRGRLGANSVMGRSSPPAYSNHNTNPNLNPNPNPNPTACPN